MVDYTVMLTPAISMLLCVLLVYTPTTIFWPLSDNNIDYFIIMVAFTFIFWKHKHEQSTKLSGFDLLIRINITLPTISLIVMADLCMSCCVNIFIVSCNFWSIPSRIANPKLFFYTIYNYTQQSNRMFRA